ncbi:MAG: kynureninase [Rubrivivax sp.]|nr:kynureninase [Rubrivivax sp.]
MAREQALALDAADALAPLRDLFELPAGVLYLDGNSLGALPRAAPQRLAEVVRQEWGEGLIRSWNTAGWMQLATRIGDKIGTLVGARPGELVVADSTSVNLFKVLWAALSIVAAQSPDRRVIVSERSNFPTDLYIAESIARERGFELKLVDAADIAAQLNDRTAVLMLTHVNYRTGAMHDMAALTGAAHDAGALAIWDLAHSAGAVPVDLHGAGADFAVGCGYKYLNGGPGAPAFVWVHPRHVERFWQPLAGWMGHAAPFEFTPGYRPAAGIGRYFCGTPAVVSMAALECGVDTLLAAAPLGGMAALRTKSLALARLFSERVQWLCPSLERISPRDDERRGSQVCFTHPTHGYAIMQALIARGVIGDFRAGNARQPTRGSNDSADILRFGFTPLYVRFVDAWDAAEHLRQVLDREEWRRPEFNQRQAVT